MRSYATGRGGFVNSRVGEFGWAVDTKVTGIATQETERYEAGVIVRFYKSEVAAQRAAGALSRGEFYEPDHAWYGHTSDAIVVPTVIRDEKA